MHSPFPETVSFCALLDEGQPPEVHPDELTAHPQACDKRRREFLLGRTAAHRAIRQLGRPSDERPIGRGSRGQPIWPDGLVGSISHTSGIAIAAVAGRVASSGLGVDVERCDRRVKEDIARLVASTTEQGWIAEASSDLRLKLLFSAKESIYKALYPLAEVFLGYHDAELVDQGGSFIATLHVAAAPGWPAGSTLDVGYRVDGEHLITWVMLEA